MLKQPFFKYSFFILLLVDLTFTAGLIMFGVTSISLDTLLATVIWFIFFYWLPAWLAAFLILSIRTKGFHSVVLECFIAVVSMSLGLSITNHLLLFTFDNYASMGNFVFFGGITWGVPIYFISRYIESRGKISQEKQARKQAQLQALRYQLNPHFMFNSLNTISAYIHSNPDLADEVLHELADILRYSLDTGEEDSVALQQEVAIIDKYFNIEKARFGDRLTVKLDIPSQLLNTQVPSLILQPIVENAIKHNTQQTQLTITIKVEKIIKHNDEILRLSISDNGSGFSDEVLNKGYGKGVGMKNLQQRMHQLPQGKVSLSNSSSDINSVNTSGAIVMVEMAV